MKNHIFDLSPDERRAGAFRRGTNDWMQKKVDNAVRKDDLDFLIAFQGESIQGDQSLVRLAKTKAKMYEYALRGLWPKAITEARNVLAQQGGEDDDAEITLTPDNVSHSAKVDGPVQTVEDIAAEFTQSVTEENYEEELNNQWDTLMRKCNKMQDRKKLAKLLRKKQGIEVDEL